MVEMLLKTLNFEKSYIKRTLMITSNSDVVWPAKEVVGKINYSQNVLVKL